MTLQNKDASMTSVDVDPSSIPLQPIDQSTSRPAGTSSGNQGSEDDLQNVLSSCTADSPMTTGESAVPLLKLKEKKKLRYYLCHGLGNLQSKSEEDHISAMTFDKQGKYLSVGDHEGRICIFSVTSKDETDFQSSDDEENDPNERTGMTDDEHNQQQRGSRTKSFPHLQYFEEIFAFEHEFNYQKSIEIMPKITALEWLNKGTNDR